MEERGAGPGLPGRGLQQADTQEDREPAEDLSVDSLCASWIMALVERGALIEENFCRCNFFSCKMNVDVLCISTGNSSQFNQ